MDDIFKQLDKIGAETKAALERFMDDVPMYLKYVRGFPEEPTMGALSAAVEARDYAAAENAVHALKGLVKNLGFTPLADATEDMLDELRDNNIPAALDAYCDIQKQYARYCELIIAWRAAE